MTYQENILEATGWWPPPNSTSGFRPVSSKLWELMLLDFVKGLNDGVSYLTLLSKASKLYSPPVKLIVKFLKDAGIWSKFRNGTLKDTDVLRVLTGASKGSGIWVAGDRSIVTKHYVAKKASKRLPKLGDSLSEGTSGNAWMFYHHYNPQLLQAVQQVIVGNTVEDVVDGLLEVKSKCVGACTGTKCGCVKTTE